MGTLRLHMDVCFYELITNRYIWYLHIESWRLEMYEASQCVILSHVFEPQFNCIKIQISEKLLLSKIPRSFITCTCLIWNKNLNAYTSLKRLYKQFAINPIPICELIRADATRERYQSPQKCPGCLAIKQTAPVCDFSHLGSEVTAHMPADTRLQSSRKSALGLYLNFPIKVPLLMQPERVDLTATRSL